MSDLLEIIDEGQQGWMSWIVSRGPYVARSARQRLFDLRLRLKPGLAPLWSDIGPDAWLEISRKSALTLSAQTGWPGPHGIITTLKNDQRSVDEFQARFSEGARYFTNYLKADLEMVNPEYMTAYRHEQMRNSADGGMSFCTPITQSTFSVALGVVDGEQSGIFCIEGED